MKIVSWILFVIILTMMVLSVVSWIIRVYQYDRNIGQYLKLADDASTAQSKLGYLIQYRNAVDKNVLEENAAYVFKQEQYTKSRQLKIVDTLVSRLQDMQIMNPTSFEYQQAMYQVSGQEFDHTLQRIDDIFEDCFIREGVWGFLLILIWWVILIFGLLDFFLFVVVYS